MHLHLLKQIWQLPQAMLKRFVSDLLRLVLLSNRPRRMAQAGFVLPTTVLLTLMVVLTATALTYRAFTRSEQNIAQREQQVILNAATPAIDRAKAKIEFLFRQDPRFPSGLPASDILYDLMSTRLTSDPAKNFAGYTGRVSILQGGFEDANGRQEDPYTLADETRVDINGDELLDNAWAFLSEGQTIVYSILVDDAVDATEAEEPGPGENFLPRPYVANTGSVDVTEPTSRAKAEALVTRTGPLATTEAAPKCRGALSEGGWQIVDASSGTLQKNFQVNAFVANGDDVGQTFETLEFQQSREAERGNKWGAWFRYDLEIFPGRAFNWNGAMHTDSNLLINRETVQLHMVSSHNSCVYSRESSEITLGTTEDGFQGQVVKGVMRTDNYPNGESPLIHVFDGLDRAPRLAVADVRLTNTNHSVTNGRPSDISVNALTLFTQDKTEHVRKDNWTRRTGWENEIFNREPNGRTINDPTARPFVDDFYRADDRWGPKPRYNETSAFDLTSPENVAKGLTLGDRITGLDQLTNPATGLDGYWERQAIRSGLRLIVGQRLELGNNQGWNTVPPGAPTNAAPLNNDPLYPAITRPTAADARFGGNHEYLQRRSLQDNLAAVQGMVVYHYQGGNGITNNGEFPAACVALTAHPGTRQSIVNSRTFGTYTNGDLKVDFLNGQGTNGWEFQFPGTFDTEGKFGQELAVGQPLGNALRNLAYFAGDPAGGAPSFKPVQDASDDTLPQVHPAPYLSMWGDFSPLRRIFAEYLDVSAGTGSIRDRYNALSFADKATLHSAACTLSMLAYNLQSEYDQVRTALASENSDFRTIATELRQGMYRIIHYLHNGNDDENGDGTPDGKIAALISKLSPELREAATWDDPEDSSPLVPGCTADSPGFQKACDVGEYFADFTLADWRVVLDETTGATETQLNDIEAFAGQIATGLNTVRDRELGFSPGGATVKLAALPDNDVVVWDPATQLTEPLEFTKINPDDGTTMVLGPESFVLKSQCDPDLFTDVISPSTPFKEEQVALALVACSKSTNTIGAAAAAKYPSLFYLFPVVEHTLRGSGANAQPDGEDDRGREEYILNPYVNEVNPTTVTFRVVGTDPIEGVGDIAADPEPATPANWVLPASSPSGVAALDTSNVDNLTHAFIINAGTSLIQVPFLDKGIFDGREQLNNRVLDIDLDALITEKVKGVTDADFWLPADLENQAEGVFFAFREDAVREDEIVRPRNASALNCSGLGGGLGARRYRIETDASCRMAVRAGTVGQDPPLTAQLISLKPVDFIADPERRTHGFRLRTASGNPADFSGSSFARKVGMTMVTDNPVYIMGDFNPHSTDGTTGSIVEEFVETLWNRPVNTAFGANFYNNRTTLNIDNFANLEKDHWRPVEVLSDAIYVLSVGFLDGAVEDGFLRALPAAEGGDATTTSYMNQNRPRFATTLAPGSVLRHQLDQTGAVTDNSPVYIDRNGTYYLTQGDTPFYNDANYNRADGSGWMNFVSGDGPRRQNVQAAQQTFVNATFVSGIVPKRPRQGYGGLHNYPRFIEYWEATDLHIAGSFIQLNFSTTATGPYEQDAWEDGASPVVAEPIGYYEAPNRRWGYDVGLIYVPPAPAARRFVTIGAPRSEYYREIPADDPYIVNLRCARDNDGNFILEGICPA